MLYCNYHYRYKDQLCELIGFLPHTGDGIRQLRIRLLNHTEVICSENDLEEIPLTESILQSCYKIKTIVRNDEWDVLWHLGNKNNVTVGEKEGQFHILPSTNVETIVEVLPFELQKGYHVIGNKNSIAIHSISDLERICSKFTDIVWNTKERI